MTVNNPRHVGIYKTYPDPLDRIDLPPPPKEGGKGFWNVIWERASIREYSEDTLTIDEIACLLWACQGITRERGEWQFRAAPSAGALYPIETYVAINRGEELVPGLYHYEVRHHRLAFLQEESAIGMALTRAALGQTMCNRAAIVVVWTAVVSRSVRKYGERAYRYIYMDAGHVGENLYLAATAMDLACCAVGAFFDDEVNAVLGLDGRDETAVYMATVGREGHP